MTPPPPRTTPQPHAILLDHLELHGGSGAKADTVQQVPGRRQQALSLEHRQQRRAREIILTAPHSQRAEVAKGARSFGASWRRCCEAHNLARAWSGVLAAETSTHLDSASASHRAEVASSCSIIRGLMAAGSGAKHTMQVRGRECLRQRRARTL